ncbi:MAG TPA: hypothetical protein VM166_14070 [Gemmatimonadaceae bacterium]|nr:hypothetical protein [Gemmatimonadaceae bacterium]
MTLFKSIIISCAAVIAGGAVVVVAANAQTPKRPRPAVRVVSNTATKPAEPVAAPVAPPAAAPEVLIVRESYNYPGAGRRDPFVSLMNTEEIRPLIGDLKLVAIAFDATGRNSVAVLRDIGTKEQYRVKVGQQIGRMRVAAIHEKNVVFGIEEFGYSRQESVAMNDSTKVRTQ